MMNLIKYTFFGRNQDFEENDFSAFFANPDGKKRAKVIRRVLREANNEQRNIMNRRTTTQS